MTTKTTLNGIRTATYSTIGSDNTVTLAKGASIAVVLSDASPYGMLAGSDGIQSDNHLVINGQVYATMDGPDTASMGIAVNGSESSVVIGASGSVMAYICIELFSDGGSLVNAGNIISVSTQGHGVLMNGSGFRLNNSGTINAYDAILAEGAFGMQIVNDKGGVITGYSTTIATQGALTIVNHGLIENPAGGYAFQKEIRGSATAVITNDGRIVGNIDLGDGNDKIDTRGGTIKGWVNGGNGNDTLVTDRAAYKLLEADGGGTDTVKSTVSYTLTDYVENLSLLGGGNTKATGNSLSNMIVGNSGDNRLTGGGGSDHLNGGRGNDRLVGGSASDTFIFSTSGGHDTITDFETIDEHIDVRKWKAVESYHNLLVHARNEDDGVMITFGDDSLFIDHVAKKDLQESHFII